MTVRRVNGAAPVHREADAGDELVLHEEKHGRGDVLRSPLAPHQRRTDRLLATGGTPRHLPFGGDHVIYFRTLDDYERLRALTGR
ncbi:MAG TPA: hypothetical protein VM597_07850, partial [Gemmataceae bacterium]|nr:hypothetical protein [Gemmataceae bacterium]